MSRPAAVVLTLAALAPAPALAQVWPGAAAVTLAAPRVQPLVATLAEPAATSERQPQTAARPAPAPARATPARLNLRPTLSLDDPAPPVEVRAKDEWSDDSGFRTRGARIAYKMRF